MSDVGNLASASIPVALRKEEFAGRLRPGMKVMLVSLSESASAGARAWWIGRRWHSSRAEQPYIDQLIERVRANADREAFVWRGKPVTYGELDAIVANWTERLKSEASVRETVRDDTTRRRFRSGRPFPTATWA